MDRSAQSCNRQRCTLPLGVRGSSASRVKASGRKRRGSGRTVGRNYLVQPLLPLDGKGGQPFGRGRYAAVSHTLTGRLGGLTAYTCAPAAGLWRDGEQTVRDAVVVYEVMVDDLDRGWWADDREQLRRGFQQDALAVRAQAGEVR